MNWKTHLLIGTLVGFGLGVYTNNNILLFSGIAGISSLIPDIDHPNSKIKQWLDMLIFPFLFLLFLGSGIEFKNSLITSLALTGVYFVLYTYLKPKHRGITHRMPGWVIFSVTLFVISRGIALPASIGYLSHLIVDRIKLF